MFAALALAVTTPLATDFYPSAYLSARDLKAKCEANDTANSSYCFAYITGVYDTVVAYETWLNLREFCVPFRTPQADLRRTFVQFMNDNPTKVAGEAASVVVVALKQAYPCSRKRQ